MLAGQQRRWFSPLVDCNSLSCPCVKHQQQPDLIQLTQLHQQMSLFQAVAAHLGITKAELLDPSAPDMAVRQALGETQVIAVTKSALGDAGE